MAIPWLSGCAIVALPAAAISVAGSAAGGAVRAGTEYTAAGVAYRTLVAPLDEVTRGMRQTLHLMAFAVDRDEPSKDGRRLVARAAGRTIDARIQRLSPATTRLRLVVSEQLIFRDRSTASEIITRLEARLVLDGVLKSPQY